MRRCHTLIAAFLGIALSFVGSSNQASAQSGSMFGNSGRSTSGLSGTSSSTGGNGSMLGNSSGAGMFGSGSTGGSSVGTMGQSGMGNSQSGLGQGGLGGNGIQTGMNLGGYGLPVGQNAFVGRTEIGGFVGDQRTGSGMLGGTTGSFGMGTSGFSGGRGSFGGGAGSRDFGRGNFGGGQREESKQIRPALKLGFEPPSSTLSIAAPEISGRFSKMAAGRPELAGINVSTDGQSRVVLSGQVADEESRDLAINLLRLEPGVRDIVDQLTIQDADGTLTE